MEKEHQKQQSHGTFTIQQDDRATSGTRIQCDLEQAGTEYF